MLHYKRLLLSWIFLLLVGCQAVPAPTLEVPTATHTALAPIIAVPAAATAVAPTPTPITYTYTYRIVNTYPHDPEAFTQGLVLSDDGELFEGTGLYGRSSLRRVELETGAVLQQVDLPAQYFGEGITLWEDRIIQLTWREQSGFIYDKDSFEQLQTFTYPTEGWGITHDGEKLIMSDGTSTLYFWDPETLAETGSVAVVDANGPVVRLNELEYVEGEVWANIWQTDLIARIDPTTGRVNSYVDLSGLLDDVVLAQPVDVLNGIAYERQSGRLFVTGKLWPALFEIEILPVE